VCYTALSAAKQAIPNKLAVERPRKMAQP